MVLINHAKGNFDLVSGDTYCFHGVTKNTNWVSDYWPSSWGTKCGDPYLWRLEFDSAVENGMPHPCVAVGLLIDEASRRMQNSLREFVSAVTHIRAPSDDTPETKVALRIFEKTYHLYCRRRFLEHVSIAAAQARPLRGTLAQSRDSRRS